MKTILTWFLSIGIILIIAYCEVAHAVTFDDYLTKVAPTEVVYKNGDTDGSETYNAHTTVCYKVDNLTICQTN